MAKNVRKQQAEIDRNLKLVDEGIDKLLELENNLKKANTVQMKEKHETDMKKEIKKLQRVRDFCKQIIKENEIKDLSRLQDARHRIEEQMENFRDLEKELKQSKLNKDHFQNRNELEGKFKYGSGESEGSRDEYDDSDSSYQNNDGEDEPRSNSSRSNDQETSTRVAGREEMEEINETSNAIGLNLAEKEWFNNILQDSLRKIASGLEVEIGSLRGNKNKTVVKKNKDRLQVLETRCEQIKQLREKTEELQLSLDIIDQRRFKRLKITAMQFIRNNGEDESSRVEFALQLEQLIQPNESPQSQHGLAKSQQVKEAVVDEKTQFQRDIAQHPEVVLEDGIILIQLKVGNILDAQDYLGSWYPAIVIDEKDSDQKQIHFLPYKANRDEYFKSSEDGARIAPIYSKTSIPADKNVRAQFQTLKTYMEAFRASLGKKTEEFKQQPLSSQAVSNASAALIHQRHTQNQTSTKLQANPLETSNTLKPGQKTKRNSKGVPPTNAQSISSGLNSPRMLGGATIGTNPLQTTSSSSEIRSTNQRYESEDNANQLATNMTTNQGNGKKPPVHYPESHSKSQFEALNSGNQRETVLSFDSKSPLEINQQPTLSQTQAQKPQTATQKNYLDNKAISNLSGKQIDPRFGGNEVKNEKGQNNTNPLLGTMNPFSNNPFDKGISKTSSDWTDTQDLPSKSLPSKSQPFTIPYSSLEQSRLTGEKNLSTPATQRLQSAQQQIFNEPICQQSLNKSQTADPGSMRRQQRVLDMLDVSFQNKTELWDQEAFDPKSPIGAWRKHAYPTVPMYAQKSNFSRFDQKTLFFAFYYQQETYQQYLAAVELKKQGWLFNKRHETWFHGLNNQSLTIADLQNAMTKNRSKPTDKLRDQGKYQYFEFEGTWMAKDMSESIELDLTQFENEIIVQMPEMGISAQGASRQQQPAQVSERNTNFRPNVDHFHPVTTPAAARPGQQQQQQ